MVSRGFGENPEDGIEVGEKEQHDDDSGSAARR